MLQFILGETGTGKSTFLISQLRNDLLNNEKVILLVPEQQAVTSEKRVEEIVADIPTINLEILNFKRMCNRIFREYGGLSYGSIDKSTLNLILWKAAKTQVDKFTEYSNDIPIDKNFIKMISQTITELKNCGISANALSDSMDSIQRLNEKFAHKLHDVSLIYREYENLLRNNFNALTDELSYLSELLSEHDFFHEYTVYIDSFNGFTFNEYKILEHMLRQAKNVFITLSYSTEKNRLIYANAKETYEKLIASAKKNNVGIVTDHYMRIKYGYKNEELKYLSENLWDNLTDDSYVFEPEHIRIIECNDIYSEVEFTVKDIRKKIRNGVRYRDIAVIARDVSEYHGVIDAIADKYSIPYFLSVRTDLPSKPLIKLMMSALNIINGNWRIYDVISYIKTGLCGITYDECDILEAYIMTWNINGRRWYDDREWTLNPSGYTPLKSEHDKMILTIVNELKLRVNAPLKKLMTAFTQKVTVKEITAALYGLLIELNVTAKLEDDEETVQIWNKLIEIFDKIVIVAGDNVISSDDYLQLLMLMLNDSDIGKIPAAIDEVIIGNAGNIRVDNIKHVYVIGVNDGKFPQPVSESNIFNDNERMILKEAGIDLPQLTDKSINDELLYFYDSVTCASESVTLIYSSSDLSGKTQKPSAACEQVMELFPAVKIEKFKNFAPLELIEGYEASFEYTQFFKNNAIGKALKNIYQNDETYGEKLKLLNIPLFSSEYRLSEKHSDELYNRDIILTQSRIDSYVLCHFSYYCRYLLGLSESRRAIFRSADVGNFIHKILEIYLDTYYSFGNHEEKRIPTDEEILDLLDVVIIKYKEEIYGDPNVINKREDHLFRRLKKILFLLLKNIHLEFEQSDFIPQFFEVPITLNEHEIAAPYKITMPDGRTIYITGIIDRIDTYSDGSRIYIRVIDYKTGLTDFSLEDIRMGLNLQMLLYLFALWKNPTDKFKAHLQGEEILPAGVLYFSARVPDVLIKTEEDSKIVIETANEKLSRKGLLLNDEKSLHAMEKEFKGKYIPIKGTSKGISALSEKSLMTIDEFETLMNEIDERIISIADELSLGDMSAEPLITNKHNACEYCVYQPICRREL